MKFVFSVTLLLFSISSTGFSSTTITSATNSSITNSSITRSNAFAMETYVGVINVQHKSAINSLDHNTDNTIVRKEAERHSGSETGTGIYLLHTTKQITPLTLVFKNGTPEQPILTGDKVQVVGLNSAGKLFVQQIKSLPGDALPF